jgi:hypothetical protein
MACSGTALLLAVMVCCLDSSHSTVVFCRPVSTAEIYGSHSGGVDDQLGCDTGGGVYGYQQIRRNVSP